MDKREVRSFKSEIRVERRSSDDGSFGATVRGHAAVFDSLSENLGGFREIIKPGAFDGVMDDDVRALFNHDTDNLPLARTKSGTLEIGTDKRGLTYEFDVPDIQLGRDLVVSLERGDIDESSFGFIVETDSWDEDEEGRIVRTIHEIRELFDVSPVNFGAYKATDSELASREFRSWQQDRTDAANKVAVSNVKRWATKFAHRHFLNRTKGACR
jgi:HK97 family phage prohead protease